MLYLGSHVSFSKSGQFSISRHFGDGYCFVARPSGLTSPSPEAIPNNHGWNFMNFKLNIYHHSLLVHVHFSWGSARSQPILSTK